MIEKEADIEKKKGKEESSSSSDSEEEIMESDELLNKKLNMSIPRAGNPNPKEADCLKSEDLEEKHDDDKGESSSSSEEEMMESEDLLARKLNMSIQKGGNTIPKDSATSFDKREKKQKSPDQENSSSSSDEEMMESDDLLTKKLNMSTPKVKEPVKKMNPFIKFVSAQETKVDNVQEKATEGGSSSSSEEEEMMETDNLLSKKLNIASILTGMYL